MYLLRRAVPWISRVWLLAYTLLISGGVWIPTDRVAHQAPVSAEPSFPCAGNACGCMTAQQCHDHCCCRRGSRVARADTPDDQPAAERPASDPAVIEAGPVLAWKALDCRGTTPWYTVCCWNVYLGPAIDTQRPAPARWLPCEDSLRAGNPSYPPAVPPA